MLTVGDKFPSFRLKAVVSIEKGKEFSDITSESHPNRWKVVFFWPKAFPLVSRTESGELGRHNKDFADRDTELLGVSHDSEYVHLAWRRTHPDLKDLPYPMLADVRRDLSS